MKRFLATRRRVGTMLMAGIMAITGVAISVPAAQADGIYTDGSYYDLVARANDPSAGYVDVEIDVEIKYNDDYETVAARGTARITKGYRASRVQVDKVVLGDTRRVLTQTGVPANSGASGADALKSTAWVNMRDGSCTRLHVRTYFSVRWTDGRVSTFNRLAPYTYGYFCRR